MAPEADLATVQSLLSSVCRLRKETLADAQTLLAECGRLRQDSQQQSLQEAPERLANAHTLLCKCIKLRQDYQQNSRELAPEHNVFRLLDVTKAEVGLHSPMLADILDPFGTHGQGTVFLRAFLDMLLNQKSDLSTFPKSELSALARKITDPARPGDWIIARERGRIDVSVRNARIGLLIFIENKIDANEQPDQLARYRRLLDRQVHSYPVRLLIYLAPRYRGSPESGTPNICLTYEDDITTWLQSCEHTGPEHVRANLRQYIDVISHLRPGGNDDLS